MLASENVLFGELGLQLEEMLKFLIEAVISLVVTFDAKEKL